MQRLLGTDIQLQRQKQDGKIQKGIDLLTYIYPLYMSSISFIHQIYACVYIYIYIYIYMHV